MARPIKQGLDYFPFDVDFFEDEKIEAISGEFGIKGEIVAIRLLSAVYRNGYFIEWSEMLKMKMLKNLPSINKDLLDQILSRLIKWKFFDENLFNSAQILTSTGIQKRYFEAMKRNRVREDLPFLLVSVTKTPINVTKTQVNATLTTQRKEKESKINIIKENIIKEKTPNRNIAKTLSNELEEKKEKSSAKKEKEKFIIPTINEIEEYCITHQKNISPERFFNFYESKGWKIGNQKMKNWKAAVNTWHSKNKENEQPTNKATTNRKFTANSILARELNSVLASHHQKEDY